MSARTALPAELGECFIQTLLDAFPGQACIVDEQGVILAVNQAWRDFAAANGGNPARVGERARYLEVCERAAGEGAQFAAGLRELLAGKRLRLELEYPCHSPQERRWFVATATRFILADRPCLLILHHDISDRQRHAEAIRVDLAVQRVRNEVLQMRTQEDWLRVVEVLYLNLRQLIAFAGCGISMVNLEERSFYTYDVSPDGVRRGYRCEFLPQSLEQVVREQVPMYRRNRQQMEEWGDNLRERHSVIDVPFAGGTLALNSEQEDAFSARDIHILERFALLLSEAQQRLQDLEQQVIAREIAEEEVRLKLGLERVRNEVLQMRTQEDWARVTLTLYQSLRELVSFTGFSVVIANLKRRTFRTYTVGPEGMRQGEWCDFLPQYLEQVVREQVPVYRRNRQEMEPWDDQLTERHSVIDMPFAGGTLALGGAQGNAFSLGDIDILERFALVLSEAHWRLQALQRQEAVRQVREAVWRMEKAEDIHQVMTVIREQLTQADLFFDEVAVNVVEIPANPRAVRYYSYKRVGSDSAWLSRSEPVGEGPMTVIQCWRGGKVVYRRDLLAEDPFGESSVFLPPLRSVVDVPFSHGTLAVNSRAPEAFSEEDIQLLEELAAVLSEGFKRLGDLRQLEERARALEQEIAQRQAAEAEIRLNLALQRVRNEVLLMEGQVDWHKVVDRFYGELHTLVGFHHCSIQFVNLEKGLYSAYTSGMSAAEFQREGPYMTLVPSLRQVVESGRPLYRRNRREMERFRDSIAPEVECVVDVPFLGGTIAMNSTAEEAFSEGDIHVLEEFAGVMNEAYRRLEDLKRVAQAESQLRQAQKMDAVGQLTAGIAHNFNNMLQSILLNLELIAAQAPAKLQAGLNEAMEEGLRAAEMIRQLMIFGRQQPAGRYGSFDLAQVVESTVDICRKTFDRKIALKAEFAPDLPLALGDPTQVQQVLLNLCLNARDALERVERSAVWIEVRAGCLADQETPEHWLYVEVEDNGCGMDEATRERIFEPFFTTKEVGKGTGLGLATVYAIVRDHQGRVECRSAPGKGSVFRVLLPLGVQGSGAEDPLQAAIPRGRETLLIVDDDQGPRCSMARLLRELGYRVLEAAEGGEGLEIFRREGEHLGLVILDLSMPGLSGGQVLARIKAQAPQLPVVLCSGYALPEDQFAGAAAVLQKPVQAAELGKTVRLVLDQLSVPGAG